MRRPAKWMKTGADDRILEYLAETDHAPPKEIAGEIRYDSQYVGRRCRTLADAGLLQNIGRGLYRITDSGTQYLAGELDGTELAEPED